MVRRSGEGVVWVMRWTVEWWRVVESGGEW